MKKSTMILSAMLLSGAAFTAQAQEALEPDVAYISGSFNEYNPDGKSEWSLTATEVDGVYRGTFDIEAPAQGDVNFNISYMGMTLVPAELVDGELAPAADNVTVTWDEGFYNGELTSTGASKTYWVLKGWEGGNLEVTLDLNDNSIILSTAEAEEPLEGDNLYIEGNFNDYSAEGLEVWSLTATDAEGVYRGTFQIPALDGGTVKFYLNYMGISLVPGVLEDGELVASTSDEKVVWDVDFYSGSFATTGNANTYWVIENWEGGNLEVTIDINEGLILLSTAEGETPVVGSELFISGSFNEYAPEGREEWSLTATEAEGVYRAVFTIPAPEEGNVEFYLDYNGFSLVPGKMVDEDIEAMSINVTVEWDDDMYIGLLAPTGVANSHWVLENWEGGNLEVTVDLNSNEIILSTAVAEEPVEGGDLYIAGSFNDFAPEGLEIWSLGQTDSESVYRGTFTIPAPQEGDVEFYLDYNGISLVPGKVVDEEIEAMSENVTVEWDEDGFYKGEFANTGVASSKWVIEDWEGGDLEVTVDFETMEIFITKVYDEPIVGGNLYIAGNFNDYSAEGLEIWSLNAENGLYEGEFEIPAQEDGLKLYFQYETMALVPGAEENGDFVASPSDVEILGAVDSYDGYFAVTGVPGAYWVIENWEESAVLKVMVDLNSYQVRFSLGSAGVESIITDGLNNGAIYNLQGVKVNENNLKSGIYIINGKKVMIKK